MTTGTSPEAAPAGRVTYIALASLLLRHRRRIVLTGSIVALATGVATLLSPRTWTATSMFTTQSRRMPSGLSGIAAQIGIAIPNLESSQSPQFFEAVLRTRDVLDAVILRTYNMGPDSGASATGTLVDYYKLKGESPDRLLASAERKVLAALRTVFNPKTGVVAVSFTARSGEMAAAVNQAFIDRLDEFNTKTRQSQATAERQFTERRLAEVAVELRETEGRLVGFLQANRVVRPESQLGVEEQRLRRELLLRQQVYTQLAQAYENAKLEEIRDMPAVTLVERPKAPLLPDRRGLLSKTLLAFLLGMLLASVVLIVNLAVRGTAAEHPAEYDEFLRLRADALRDVRRPWQLLGLKSRR